MNCEEFLRQFREALDGKVSEQIIQDNANYYRTYINGQIAGGKSEAEVLAMLGDPRLLAKTIEESSKFASDSREEQSSYTGGYGNYNHNTAQSRGNEYINPDDRKHAKLPGWLITTIVVAVVLLILMIAFRIFTFFAPVIVVFMLGSFVYRVVRSWFNEH